MHKTQVQVGQRPDTLNLIEEEVGNSLTCIGTGDNFLTAQVLRSTIKQDLMKLESFCKAEDTVSRTKWQPKDWESIFNSKSDRGLIFKMYKELKKLDTNNGNNP